MTERHSKMQTFRLPPMFYEDHRSRDLPEQGHSEETGTRGRSVVVAMDDDAFRDLYSDARHYSDRGIAADMGMPGLAASARATVKALRKQNPDLAAIMDAEQAALEREWLTR